MGACPLLGTCRAPVWTATGDLLAGGHGVGTVASTQSEPDPRLLRLTVRYRSNRRSRTVRRTRRTRRPDQPFWDASVHGTADYESSIVANVYDGFYLRERETDHRCRGAGCRRWVMRARPAHVAAVLGGPRSPGLTLQARDTTKQARAFSVFSAAGHGPPGGLRAAWPGRVSRRAG